MLKEKPVSLVCASCGSDNLEVGYGLEPHEINVVCKNCGNVTQMAILPSTVDPTCTQIQVNSNCNKEYIC